MRKHQKGGILNSVRCNGVTSTESSNADVSREKWLRYTVGVFKSFLGKKVNANKEHQGIGKTAIWVPTQSIFNHTHHHNLNVALELF